MKLVRDIKSIDGNRVLKIVAREHKHLFEGSMRAADRIKYTFCARAAACAARSASRLAQRSPITVMAVCSDLFGFVRFVGVRSGCLDCSVDKDC